MAAKEKINNICVDFADNGFTLRYTIITKKEAKGKTFSMDSDYTPHEKVYSIDNVDGLMADLKGIIDKYKGQTDVAF